MQNPGMITTSQLPQPCPQLLKLAPSTLNPEPVKPKLSPQLPNPEPIPSTLDPLPPTLDPQSLTLNPQPSILYPRPSTLNPRPSTLDPRFSTLERCLWPYGLGRMTVSIGEVPLYITRRTGGAREQEHIRGSQEQVDRKTLERVVCTFANKPCLPTPGRTTSSSTTASRLPSWAGRCQARNLKPEARNPHHET